MVLYATTRWVGAYYEVKSLLPYKEALEFLNARKQEEAGFNITLPTDFWSVANETPLNLWLRLSQNQLIIFFLLIFFPLFFKIIFLISFLKNSFYSP